MIVLETERLLFRDHEPGDLELYCAMEADPEVRRYVGGAPRPAKRRRSGFETFFFDPSRIAWLCGPRSTSPRGSTSATARSILDRPPDS